MTQAWVAARITALPWPIIISVVTPMVDSMP